jgi:hypothetical protein
MAHVITYTKSRLKLAALGQADRAGRGMARLEANEELAKLAGIMLARYPHMSPEELEKAAGIKFLGSLARGVGGRVAGLARRLFKAAPKAAPKVVKRPRVRTRRVGWQQRKVQVRAQQRAAAPSAARSRRLARAGRQAPPPTSARGAPTYKVQPPPPAPATAQPAVGAVQPRTVRSGATQPSAPVRGTPAPQRKVVRRKRGVRPAPGSRAGAPAARQPGQVATGPKVAPGQPAPQAAPATARGGTVSPGPAAKAPAAAAEKSPGFLRRWWKPMALGAGALGLYGAGKGGAAAIRMMEQSRQSPWAYGAAWSPTAYGYGQQPYGQFQQSIGM